jgi:general secretion pathway protein I
MPARTLSVKRQSQQGFSLIEILVAFMILAMSLTVIFRIFSGGLRNISLAEDYARAQMIAESQLSSIGVITPLQTGTTTGEWGERFRWESVIEHYQPWQQEKALITPVTAYHVTVNVYWQHSAGNSQISLSSVRLQHSTDVPGQG